MYAIVECGGKQYRVAEGDVLRVEKLDAAVGSTVNLEKVLMLNSDKTYVGTPLVEGAVVSCKVLDQDKDRKVIVFHYKAKKNIRKRYGHRQPFTSLLVESISRNGEVFKLKKDEVSKPVENETAVAVEEKPVGKTATAAETVGEKPAKKTAAAKKMEAAEKPPVKKAAAKKAETAATAGEKPVRKAASRTKKSETEGQ